MAEERRAVGKFKFLTKDGSISDAILYCHMETVALGSGMYYLAKKDVPADSAGLSLVASTASSMGKLFGTGLPTEAPFSQFVYPLSGVAKVLAATVYATYRAYRTGGTVYGYVRILIRKNDGVVREFIANYASACSNFGSSWATHTGADYSFAEYSVVDETDWLEIDYYANVTKTSAGKYAYLRIDDNSLDTADQTRSQDWSFQTSGPPPAGGVLAQVI